jgi:hypothetical protein
MFSAKQSTRSFKQDHNQGKDAERASHPYLQTLTQHPLMHHLDPLAPWDFESKTTLIEHKDRNCFVNSYETTMIDYLKVERAYKTPKRVWYAFRFIDGLYVIKFNKAKFEEYAKKSFKLDDRCDYKERDKERIYIPIQDLTCLARFETPALFLPD